MDINQAMSKFRLANRELFNNYFYELYDTQNMLNNQNWTLDDSISRVNAALFKTMVTERFCCDVVEYGQANPHIRIKLHHNQTVPININRETDSGYWDFPIEDARPDALLSFVCFFDWDEANKRKNQYVRVKIEEWPEQPELTGKDALIEARYVEYNLKARLSDKKG